MARRIEGIRELRQLAKSNLDGLVDQATRAFLQMPRQGWRTLALTSLALRQLDAKTYNLALLDLHLAWLAGIWGYPRRLAYRAERARQGFLELNAADWAAAAIIGLNSMPWMRPNFVLARTDLEEAIEVVSVSGLQTWRAHGLHALAFAEMLTGQQEQARRHFDAASECYLGLGDELNARRVGFSIAGWYRRAGKIDHSSELLEKLRKEFLAGENRVDAAKASYHQGFSVLVRGEDYPRAEEMLTEAAAEFAALEMGLWAAQAHNGLAQATLAQGKLKAARSFREEAIPVFVQQGLVGLQSDCLNDQARLEFMHGNLDLALKQIERAILGYELLGAIPSALNARINKGSFLISQSRYQLALQTLERAQRDLLGLDNAQLLAFCCLQLSRAWLGLGNSARALAELNQAAELYERVQRPDLQAEVLQLMGLAEIAAGNRQAASECLERAQTIVSRTGDLLLQVSVMRQQGEFGLVDSEVDQLRASARLAQENNLETEVAASQVGLAEALIRVGEFDQGAACFELARSTNAGSLPELDVRIGLGLAETAVQSGNAEQALEWLEQGIAALQVIRRDLVQPELAGGFAERWTEKMDWAVGLAASADQPALTLAALSAFKAQSFLRLATQRVSVASAGEAGLDSLKAEITWLMEEIRNEPVQPGRANPRRRALGARLRDCRAEFSDRIGKLERGQIAVGESDRREPHAILLEHLTLSLHASYGPRWLALDYYLSQQELILAWVSPNGHGVLKRRVSPADKISLEACTQVNYRSGPALNADDLARLSRLLLPSEVYSQLAPEVVLVIAPHRQLHDVPWAGLPVGQGITLVDNCLPILTPSLAAWLQLHERDPRQLRFPLKGLICSVTNFRQGFENLPLAEREADWLEKQSGIVGRRMDEAKLTAAELGNELARAAEAEDFVHIATHLEADRETGRFSGIVLPDEIFLLDALERLPSLAVLSGCNGTRALTFPGDERQDFVSAFLLAGASSVVGSIWKVEDKQSFEVMVAFYEQLMSVQSPHVAMATAQRQLSLMGADWKEWGGFQVVGI